jgi:hypothetical protein
MDRGVTVVRRLRPEGGVWKTKGGIDRIERVVMTRGEVVDNYAKLANENLDRLYENLPGDLAERLAGEKNGHGVSFTAFGRPCMTFAPDGITSWVGCCAGRHRAFCSPSTQ